MEDLKKSLMDDTVKLKLQETLLNERINLARSQNEMIRNLKHTRARTKFIAQNGTLNVNIYKYEPNFHLEIVAEGESSVWPESYIKARDRIKKRKDYRLLAKKRYEELKEKNYQSMESNMALNFLFGQKGIN